MSEEHLPYARNEAVGLLPLLKHGTSIEEVRLLIQVPATQEKTLRTFAVENPLAGRMFLSVIEFRRRVLEEFNRLATVSVRRDRRNDLASL